jgi:hypothetical protein
MNQPTHEQIRKLAYLLYRQKQGMPWCTSGNTPEAAKSDWRAAEEILRHPVEYGPPTPFGLR